MFSRWKKNESAEGDDHKKSTRTIITKTVENNDGTVCSNTTTSVSCTKDGIDCALTKLDIDPLKYTFGSSSVTKKTTIYTDSNGKREVIEEIVDSYGDQDNSRNFFHKISQAKDQDHLVKDFMCKPTAPEIGYSDVKNVSAKGKDKKIVEISNFEDDCLKAHNNYRTKHGVPALILSKEMCAYSQEWADHLAATDSFKHRTQGRKYGENIFMKWSSDPNHTVTGSEPVDSWYSEIKDHTFGKEPSSLKSGHFTQVIWKESEVMGVAWARSKSGKVLVVANYNPAGNFIGKFAQNVPPPKK